MTRAVAPARRSGSQNPGTEVDPPVTWNPSNGFGIKLVVRWSGLDADLLERHFEFLGNQHRHRRVGALAHLDLRHDERDAVVRPDAHKGIGGKGLLGNLRRSAN